MTGVLSKNIKNTILIFLFAVNTNIVFATVHQIQVWNGYYQFLPPSNLTVNLGDTIQWVPLDPPSMYHSITSYNIPIGATSFDEPWQLPSDTFFQYVPQIAGLYQYHCTPHISFGMLGEFTVISNDTFNCADSIQITDVTITSATQTVSIGIYNGYNSFLNYPYVLCTLDANGDTLHTGALNSFGAFGLDTSWYTYSTINSSLPVLPISVYFVYTGWTFLTDTCILTFNDFTTNTVEYLVNQKKEILKITDFNGKETHPATNVPLIYMYKNGLVEKRMILE